MEQHFASLSKRQTMLLLTAVTFGGNEAMGALEHLPDEEAELLKHRAAELMHIPRDKRIPLLVQEIKRLVTARKRQLQSADPARLAQVLSKERPAMVEVVLRALPSQMADAVRQALPNTPVVKLQREVRPDVLSIIRWKLENALNQNANKVSAFKFSDLLTLQSREVLTICDRMGARALATAIAGLADADREAFLNALPPDQKSLAQRAAEAGKARKLTEDDSKTVLEMHEAIKNPSLGMRSAGAQRLARAAVAQSPEFAARLIERHGGELGKLLIKWIKEERNKPPRADGGRGDIVEQMERLAQRGVIDRPMRLPPPPRPPNAVPGQGLPGGKLMAPVPRGPSGAPDRRPPLGPPPAQRGPVGVGRPLSRSQQMPQVEAAPPSEPKRDFMAERNARRAGAVSARPAGTGALPQRRVEPPAEPVPPRDPRLRTTSDPNLRAKVIREPVAEGRGPVPSQGPKPRAMTSPALQEIPRRKAGGRGGTGSSPVLKTSAGKVSSRNRGPGTGSG